MRSSFSVSGLGTSGCCSVQFEFDIFDKVGTVCDNIPKLAEVVLSGQGFVSQPFFVNSRSSANHVCHCVCYDRMCMVDKPFKNDFEFNFNFDKGIADTIDGQAVLSHIAEQCGFASYSGAAGLSEIKFRKSELSNTTCRSLLDEITKVLCAVAICGGVDGSILQLACLGNFTFSPDNVTSEAYTEIDYRGKTVVTGLNILNSETDELFEFGDSSGHVIEIESKYANVEIANAVWERVNGYIYKSWNCEKALCISASQLMGAANFSRIGFENDSNLILGNPIHATDTSYSFDSTGVYFSGGAAVFNDWQYQSRLERDKVGVNKQVGSMTVLLGGRTRYGQVY